MEDNNLKFLLSMPLDLNEKIKRISSSLHQSKAAFVRDSIRKNLVYIVARMGITSIQPTSTGDVINVRQSHGECG